MVPKRHKTSSPTEQLLAYRRRFSCAIIREVPVSVLSQWRAPWIDPWFTSLKVTARFWQIHFLLSITPALLVFSLTVMKWQHPVFLQSHFHVSRNDNQNLRLTQIISKVTAFLCGRHVTVKSRFYFNITSHSTFSSHRRFLFCQLLFSLSRTIHASYTTYGIRFAVFVLHVRATDVHFII